MRQEFIVEIEEGQERTIKTNFEDKNAYKRRNYALVVEPSQKERSLREGNVRHRQGGGRLTGSKIGNPCKRHQAMEKEFMC